MEIVAVVGVVAEIVVNKVEVAVEFWVDIMAAFWAIFATVGIVD